MPISALTIHARRPEDLPLYVDVYNSARPPAEHRTLEQMTGREQVNEDEGALRLLAFEGDLAVGIGELARNRLSPEHRLAVDLTVRPDHRRHGIGRALYRRLRDRAIQRDADELMCMVPEPWLAPIAGWLESEDFHEVSRMRHSELALTGFDAAAYGRAEERPCAENITFTTLAEVDSEESRHKLWELVLKTERDVPLDVPAPERSFDQFQSMLDQPECLHDCLVIARDGVGFVGVTIVGQQAPEVAGTWMTGVEAAYRNRGVALALKLRSIRLAQQRGYRAMRTSNHVNNPAMLAVNARLGYVPLGERVLLVKKLRPLPA